MDDKTIMDACAYLALATGERQSDERVLAYVEALRDLKNEDYFVKAVSLLQEQCEHFPKIPEIRAAYTAVMNANTRFQSDDGPAWQGYGDLMDHCIGPCDQLFRLDVLMRNNGFCSECRDVILSSDEELALVKATMGMPWHEALAYRLQDYRDRKYGGGIGAATDPGGVCSDCGKDVKERWALGPGLFCRRCCTSRSKVKAKLDITGLLRDMEAV